MKKILVIYLSTKYTKRLNLKKFIHYYTKYKAGITHKLLICFKGLDNKEIDLRTKLLKKIDCIKFTDAHPINDYEFGSLRRILKNYNNNVFLYLNDHTFPNCHNWLYIFKNYYKRKTLIGATASCSSHSTNSIYRKHTDNYLKYILLIIIYYFTVPKFPNPHIRTTGFMTKSNYFLKFIKERIAKNKFQAHLIESGNYSFTNYFKKRKFNILVVNKDNKSFKEKDWAQAKTFCYENQNKSILSDNQTRAYLKLDKRNKKKKQLSVWGS
jgi:hypothetical protein